MYCPSQNIFGRVGEGVHGYRVMNIAVVDVVATILGAYVLYLCQGGTGWSSFLWILTGLFVLGICMHRLFCVRTTIDKLLFP